MLHLFQKIVPLFLIIVYILGINQKGARAQSPHLLPTHEKYIPTFTPERSPDGTGEAASA